MRSPQLPTPEALSNNAGKWHVTAAPAIAGAARVCVETRTMSAPMGDTPHARALRHLATVRAAIDPTDATKAGDALREWLPNNTPRALIDAADAYRVASYAQHHRLAHTAQILDKAGLERLAAFLDTGHIVEAAAEWLRLQATSEARRASLSIGKRNPELSKQLAKERRALVRELRHMNAHYTTKSDEAGYSLHYIQTMREIVGRLHRAARVTMSRQQQQRQQALREMPEDMEANPESNADALARYQQHALRTGDRWHAVNLWRGALTKRHTGQLARRTLRRVSVGRTIRDPQRLYTDPLRRAFSTRGRGLGATVVLDASGSMSLTEEDMTALLDAAGGATIYAYRHAGRGIENLYLLAHNGRRVENLPLHAQGSNGLDALALAYAQTTHEHGQPFVWITDGEYNGMNTNEHDPHGAADILAAYERVPFITYRNIPEAAAALERRARGGHLDAPSLPATVTQHLETITQWRKKPNQ